MWNVPIPCGKYNLPVRTGHHKSEVRHSQHSLTAHPSSPGLIHSQVHRIPWFLLAVSGTAPSGPGGWNGWGESVRTAAATMCGNYGRQAIIRKTCSNQIVAKIFYVNYLIKWQKEKPLNSQGFYQATGRTRTGDPRITNALRYQLRYSGIRTAIAIPLMQQGCCLSNSLAIMT